MVCVKNCEGMVGCRRRDDLCGSVRGVNHGVDQEQVCTTSMFEYGRIKSVAYCADR